MYKTTLWHISFLLHYQQSSRQRTFSPYNFPVPHFPKRKIRTNHTFTLENLILGHYVAQHQDQLKRHNPKPVSSVQVCQTHLTGITLTRLLQWFFKNPKLLTFGIDSIRSSLVPIKWYRVQSEKA